MLSTPTTGGRRRGKKKTVRRIIETESIESPNEIDDSKKEKEKAFPDSSLGSLPEEGKPNETKSPKEGYSLRSFNQTNVSVDLTQFQKSVYTPSRAKSRKYLVQKSSTSRTPLIRLTSRRDYSVGKGKPSNALKEKWKEDVQNILKKTWKINYASSLSGFNYGRKNIKSAYERTLKTRILEMYPSYHMTVKITTSSFLNQNPQKTDSVFFEVRSLVPNEDKEKDTVVTLYQCVLIKSEEVQSKSLPGVEWFPVMLHSGLDLVHTVFLRWFQSAFGCYVSGQGLPLSSILWVAGIWLPCNCTNNHKKDENDRDVMLHYTIRPTSQVRFDAPNDKGNITLKMKCKSVALAHLWTKIRRGGETEINADNVARFHYSVEKYMESLTHLPKGFLHLSQVKTTCISLAVNGTVKMTCNKSFISMLHHLVEIFTQTFHFQNLGDMAVDNEDITDFDEDSS